MGKTVLVTGAGGFIGSHLTERLVRDGHRVRVLVRYNGRDDRGHLDDLPRRSRPSSRSTAATSRTRRPCAMPWRTESGSSTWGP